MTVSHRVIESLQRIPPIVADGAIGAGIFAVGAVEVTLSKDTYSISQWPGALALLALGAVGLTIRRRNLLAAYALVLLSAIGGHLGSSSHWGALLTDVVLLYTVSERTGVIGSLLALGAAFAMRFLAYGLNLSPKFSDIPALVQTDFFYLTLAWFAGRAQARRRAIAADLERSAGELQEERDRLAQSAVATERARIARELHALVLRGVEQMLAETRAARGLLATRPERSSQSIAAIEATGRGALVEMRRLLTVLRTRNDATAHSLMDGHSRTEPPASFPSWDARPPRAPCQMARPGSFAAERVQRARAWIAIPLVTDGLVVLVLAIIAVAEPFSSYPLPHGWIDVVLVAVVLGALLFRRLHPVVVLAVIASVVFVQNQFLGIDTNAADHAIFVAVFTVAAHRTPWWSVAAIGAEIVAYESYVRSGSGLALIAGWTALFVFVVIAGIAVREGRRLTAELREQSDLIRRTREERIQLAVVEERSRIARDVHDMVAHGVTLMVIQAGAARWLAEGDPRKANRALASVEQAGQEALRELHSLVGSLGGTGDGAVLLLAGQLTIPSLVGEAIESGTQVELVIRGEPRELDAGLEVSLCRIVQEALTNVRKHAPGARAWVDLAYTREGVEVEVVDSGGSGENGRPHVIPGAGQGLVGIAERAALFGGQADTGPTADGGFRVRASLAEERVQV